MNTQITITQEALNSLHNAICYASAQLEKDEPRPYIAEEIDASYKLCAYMGHALYEEWASLPEGSPYKDLYRDEIWSPYEYQPTTETDDNQGASAQGTEPTDQPRSGEGRSQSNQPSRRASRRPAD